MNNVVQITTHDIPALLNRIQHKETKAKLLQMHSYFLPQMKAMPAAVTHHHSWVGGYHQHVYEVIVNCIMQIEAMQKWYGALPDGVGLDTAIMLAWLHDLDKLNRYEYNPRANKQLFRAKPERLLCESSALVLQECAVWELRLTEADLHCLAFHHGAYAPVALAEPWATSSPMATILHTADLMSAHIHGRQAQIKNLVQL